MKGRVLLLGLGAAICAGAYTYDCTSDFTSTWCAWQLNGTYTNTPDSNTLEFQQGSLIYTPTVSGANANDYEVSTSFISNSGGTFTHFLRATTGSGPGWGSYISVELNWNSLSITQCVNGSVTVLASTSMSVLNGSMRSVIYGTNLLVYINGILAMTQTVPLTTGQPGIGGVNQDDSNNFQSLSIGPHWTTAPAVTGTFATSVYPTTASMKWQPPSDGSGPGIYQYKILRNGVSMGVASAAYPEYLDATVQASQTYTYTIQAVDWHGNMSSGTLNITTPASATGPGAPPNTADPRRVGVRANGSYWGGGGEQLDTLSGNLNFAFPLLKAQGRTGWSVPVNLVYNSQNWRQDNGANWQLGYDVGFGFGWKMLIGSVTPLYASSPGPVDHYVFTDNSGSEYRLDQNTGGVWSSPEGIYVWFDANTNKLHFKDGMFWVMGSVSGGNEADLGTMYPTIVEDANGNQVVVKYDHGAGLAATSVNTSARITLIEDVRGVPCPASYVEPNGACYVPGYPYTYTFQYDGATPVSHLRSFGNVIQTGEMGALEYTAAAELSPPFGADPSYYGKSTAQLTNFYAGGGAGQPTGPQGPWYYSPGTGAYHFTYDWMGSQELTQVTFPTGGHLRWDYGSFAYSGTRILREVTQRYVAADAAGATEWTYPIMRPDAQNAVTVHSGMTLTDASGNGAKKWTFLTPQTAQYPWQTGMVSDFRQLAAAGSSNAITHDTYTWAQDAAGNPYISAKTSVMDEGTGNAQSALTTQTLDRYGNVTQSVVYPYNNTLTALRTYNNIYLDDTYVGATGLASAYIENYIRNRLLTGAVTVGGATKTLAQNTYDSLASCAGGSPAGVREFDSTSPTPYCQKGLLSQAVTPSRTVANQYNSFGAIWHSSGTDGSSLTTSSGSATNYAAPGSIATATYSETVGYNTWLGMAQTTGANGEQLYFVYDAMARPATATSPYGATTSYLYSDSNSPYISNPAALPKWVQRVGPDGFTRTTLDGLGRAVRVERGTNANSIQSSTDMVYAPCACSPLGKVQKVSQPYAPGGTPVWTVYTYDAIGRTLTMTQPDGASTSSTSYSGNQTTVTDAAGKWKSFTNDVQGNLMIVTEPDPANQPSGTLSTGYTYDWMNHLSGVTMARAGTTQTRTFVYDDAGRLTSATNPENGTVTYTYNADNTLQYKHDAKGQDTVYTYDTTKRVTEIQRYPTGKNNAEDQCQRVTYSYDTNPYDATFSQNAAGRLAAEQYLMNCAVSAIAVTEMYSYHAAGAVTKKRTQLAGTVNFDAGYGYTSAGLTASVTYPAFGTPTTLTYGYDGMGRAVSMTDNIYSPPLNTLVSNVQYDVAGRMTSLQRAPTANAGATTLETMTYNVNGQVSAIGWVPVSNPSSATGMTYTYSSTQNNGQITQAVNTVTGETVSYQYDALKRLMSATAAPNVGSTPAAYAETFQYDGFGNLTAKVLNGTTTGIAVNAGTNQLSNATYDANGNMTSGAGGTFTYDVGNRMLTAAEASGGTDYYGYAPDNKRVYRKKAAGGAEWTVYGARGERLLVLDASSTSGPAYWTVLRTSVWFGGKLISEGGAAVLQDRVGTNMTGGGRFYPFGDEITSTGNDKVKFGTYNRDGFTGLDNAENRYYASTYGRFNTPDSYGGSAGPQDPGSWNRYSYTRGDPVNRFDPHGLDDCDPISDPEGCCDPTQVVGAHPMFFGPGDSCMDPQPPGGPGPAPPPKPPPPTCEDQLVDTVHGFLASHYPSLAGYAGMIEAVGATDDIDPRFIAAIAAGENGQGKNNPFGLGGNGSNQYTSLSAAIMGVGVFLDKLIFTWHETTIDQLWSGNKFIVDPKKPWIIKQPPGYCVGSSAEQVAGCQNTGNTIAGYLKSEGGDPNKLVFPCKD